MKLEINKASETRTECDNCFECSKDSQTITVWTHEMTLCPACLRRLSDEINLILDRVDKCQYTEAQECIDYKTKKLKLEKPENYGEATSTVILHVT